MRVHGVEPRGLGNVTLSPLHEGRFGRMFRKLPPAPEYGHTTLSELAERMREEEGTTSGAWGQPDAQPEGGDNSDIPAGYTYFGQFIDHDITFDPNSLLQQKNDPDALHDFRTPRFDLDSVYGSGPVDEPFQYDQEEAGKGLLLLGQNPNLEPDLPRNSQQVALIGDPRNDENSIVSQIHLAFIKLHNKFFREATDQGLSSDLRFDRARQLVRWHYQWVVINDYLTRLVGAELVGRLFQADKAGFDLPHYRPTKNAYLPVEFSAAAFRFGHSQVRSAYNLSSKVQNVPIFLPRDDVGPTDDLRGGKTLPQDWTIDWSQFLVIGGSTPQPSRLIDHHLSPALFDLPRFPAEDPQSLSLRNLLRGQALCLPSGQDVARHLRIDPVAGADLAGGVLDPTPLWFYILAEPSDDGGRSLGPTGSRIVAEVLLGLFKLDPSAYINVQPDWNPLVAAPGWDPLVPAEAEPDRGLVLADLIVYANS